ncbi:MAG: hypothetical protein U1D69_08075, partial [Polynucleobacter sp.]|nr:hypothetical protein [Polynucleobacter sp.]
MQLVPINQKKNPLDFSRGFCITGGSGETRTRDQRIKRSRASSKTYIAYGFERPKNECAIEYAIAFWCKVRICGPDFEL